MRIARLLRVVGATLLFAAALARAEPTIGILQYEAAPDGGGVALYLEKLRALGLVEGKNLRIERRYAEGRKDRFAPLVQDLARAKVDVIVTLGHDMAKAGKEFVPGVPIIAFGSEDPVRSGLVKSLAKPGGNVTGVTFMTGEIAEKRLEILKATIPSLNHVAVVWEPEHVDTYYEHMQKAAAGMGMRLSLIKIETLDDVDGIAKSAARAGAQAVFIVPSRLTQSNARRVATQLLAAKLPGMSAYHTFAEAGGLMSYGADIPELIGRLAVLTQRVLAGARPADLPIELPNRLVLVANRGTARALGLEIPQSILLRADRVVD